MFIKRFFFDAESEIIKKVVLKLFLFYGEGVSELNFCEKQLTSEKGRA